MNGVSWIVNITYSIFNSADSTFYSFQASVYLQTYWVTNWCKLTETYSVGLTNLVHSNAMICEYIKCINIHSSLWSVGIQTREHWVAQCYRSTFVNYILHLYSWNPLIFFLLSLISFYHLISVKLQSVLIIPSHSWPISLFRLWK